MHVQFRGSFVKIIPFVVCIHLCGVYGFHCMLNLLAFLSAKMFNSLHSFLKEVESIDDPFARKLA